MHPSDNMKVIFKMMYTRYLPFVLVVATIMAAVICFCTYSNKENTDEDIFAYSQEFFDRYYGGASDSALKQLLEDGRLKIDEDNDSSFYADMKKFGRKMFEKGDQILAFEYLKNVLAILDGAGKGNDDMMRYKAYCYLLLGAATDEVGLSSLSQGYYFSGMKIADIIGDSAIKYDFYNNLGMSLYKGGSKDRAESFYRQALAGAKSIRNDVLLYIVYNNISELNAEKGDLASAIDNMLKAVQTVDKTSLAEDYYSLQSALGSLYIRDGNLPMAYACLSNAYRNQCSLGNKAFLYNTSLMLADYFNKTTKPDSVRKYMDIAWKMADVADNPWHKITLLDKESDMAVASGNYREAYGLQMRLKQMKDSLRNVENIQQIERANNIYEIEKKAFEEKQGIARWNPVVVFVLMSLVVLLLVAFAVCVMVVKRRSDRINEEKAQTASELAELREKQLAEERDRKEKQEEELRLFNQKLTSFTLERIKNNEKLEEVSMEMKKALVNVPPRDKDQQTLLRGIIAKVTALLSDTQWDEFQYYFEKVHPDFYLSLDKAHPDLTAKDRRLCALISLGLSTKDIASIINLEVRSVESSRNRLRKKLGLDNDQNLFDYIRSLFLNVPSARLLVKSSM